MFVNHSLSSIPGSYPASALNIRSNSSNNSNINKNATNMRTNMTATSSTSATVEVSRYVEDDFEFRFSSNQLIRRKTRAQHEFLAQLEGLCYILIFYQFIKFCYSACLIPTLLHVLVLAFVNYNFAIDPETGDVLLRAMFEESLDHQERIELLKRRLPRICFAVYCKTVFVMAYHILFICTWMISLVDEGQLDELETGSWWFVSFIGEEPPIIHKELGYWAKAIKLGLVQLLLLDIIILFLQLVLFQCIFKQSLAVGARSLDEREVELIRGKNIPLSLTIAGDDSNSELNGLHELGEGRILALQVRLYELLLFWHLSDWNSRTTADVRNEGD
ncbi:hypothetical protein LELG_01408 [Lodderomyces elongisporus NRRL YB-4239]|uniref:Uncharacterized protein n=1 Tax=Lodderomyces elongisporus (strain ATCC 11503 / CBS 2605 / JCM 1781 / NBRC 1676 / NRRL YB-4239) TaxID=379508 RepID=A5DVM2_LODEL|nr:hypothetical protein LELG_01408 [Lodderomyces elongisporus NRRL YB-4239]